MTRPGASTEPPAVGRVDLTADRRGERGDRALAGMALGAGLVVLVVLGLIAVATTREAWPAFEEAGLGFVLSDDWSPADDQYGALAFVYGTVLVSVIALVLSVPVSVGIALFANEVAPRRTRQAVLHVVDLLAAIPSVVYGLWGVLVLAPALQPLFDDIGAAVEGWPVLGTIFGEGSSGRSFLTAGTILAVMITPIITSLSREVIATVPDAQREAAYGMGATRWEVIRAAVLPWSRSGITGAVMLGLGRAMGETIAVALVIGSTAQITLDVLAPGDTMAAVIANEFGEATGVHRSALIGLGVVLFVVTIVINVAARAVVTRMDRRLMGVG